MTSRTHWDGSIDDVKKWKIMNHTNKFIYWKCSYNKCMKKLLKRKSYENKFYILNYMFLNSTFLNINLDWNFLLNI